MQKTTEETSDPKAAVADVGKRYRSIRIREATLARFEKDGKVFTHKATAMQFKRVGNCLVSITGKGITKTEYIAKKLAKSAAE